MNNSNILITTFLSTEYVFLKKFDNNLKTEGKNT